MRRWTIATALLLAVTGALLSPPQASIASTGTDIVSIKGSKPAVRKGSKGTKASKGKATRREPQVIAIGGSASKRTAYASKRTSGLAGPRITPIRSKSFRISASSSFGVKLIRNRNSSLYDRYGGSLRRNGYYASPRGSGNGRNRIPSFIGVTP
jgi:hypothetical protein